MNVRESLTKRSGAKKDRQFVTALARGLQILRCFSPHRRELGTVEIAQRVGLPQSTVWRLCYTLGKLGYLTPSADGQKLRINASVLALGYAAAASMDIVEAAAPRMQELADRFQAGISLACRDALSMLIIQRCHARDAQLLLNLHVGSRLPIEASAAGWTYLSALEGPERTDLLTQLKLANRTRFAKFKSDMQAARVAYQRDGYVVNAGQVNPNVTGVAVALMSLDKSTVYTLSAGGPSQSFGSSFASTSVAPALLDLAQSLRPMIFSRRKRTKAASLDS